MAPSNRLRPSPAEIDDYIDYALGDGTPAQRRLWRELMEYQQYLQYLRRRDYLREEGDE